MLSPRTAQVFGQHVCLSLRGSICVNGRYYYLFFACPSVSSSSSLPFNDEARFLTDLFRAYIMRIKNQCPTAVWPIPLFMSFSSACIVVAWANVYKTRLGIATPRVSLRVNWLDAWYIVMFNGLCWRIAALVSVIRSCGCALSPNAPTVDISIHPATPPETCLFMSCNSKPHEWPPYVQSTRIHTQPAPQANRQS